MALLDAGDELGRALIAVGMGEVGRADAAGRIAAQRHDVADADLVIAVDDLVDLAARGADAGRGARPAAASVSLRMRAMVEWVRSRVEPPAP